MKVFVKKLFLVVVVILIALMPINGLVGAAKRKDVDYQRNAYNNIMFYDDTDCETPTPGKTCSTVSGSDITWIGDSLSVYAESNMYGGKFITEALPGVDYGDSYDDPDSYIQGCKFINSPTICNAKPTNPPGLEILERIVNDGKLRSVLVFALGTNGGDWNQSYLDKIISLVGSNTKVVLVNSWTNEPEQDFTANNNFLRGAADDNDNIYLADWAAVANASFFSEADKIHPTENGGLKVWVDTVKNALPSGKCSSEACGSTAREIYWSAWRKYFNEVQVAGIMGNMDREGGYNPVSWEVYWVYEGKNGVRHYGAVDGSGKVLVSWDEMFNLGDGEMLHLIDSGVETTAGMGAVGTTTYLGRYLRYINDKAPDLIEYAKNPDKFGLVYGDAAIEAIGENDYKRLVQLEVDFSMEAIKTLPTSVNLDEFNSVTTPEEAAVYWTKYFEVCIECATGAEQSARADGANKAYDELKGFTCSAASVPSGTNTGFSSTETLSGTNNVKFDATDKEIKDLLLFSLWKAKSEDRDYSEILSGILDDFDKSGEGEKGVASSLIKYVEESDKFKYRESYDSFKKDFLKIIKEIKIESGQLEDAEKIIKNGLRPTTEARVQTTNGLKKDANECKDGSKKGKGAERIAETAALMAWPVQSWQTGADDFSSDKIGKCYNDFDSNQPKGWIAYTYNQTCRNTPRVLYKQAYAAENRLDCGVFSLSVLKQLDLIDSTTVGRGQPGAGGYFREHADEWKEIKVNSESDLKPGDVLWNSGHIMIYVGEKYGGDFGIVAHASVGCRGGCQLPGEGGRVGQISGHDELNEFTGFRYIGDKLGGGDFGEGGDAIANAAEYLAWPNTIGGQANADAGILTDEYRQAKDEWWGPNDGVYWNGGDDNDVSCARFTSLSILVSGADPGFQAAPPPSRANIRGVGDNPDSGLEGYLRRSSNWEDVTNEKDYKRGDVFIRSDVGKWHVYIYLGGGLIAEGANRDEGKNMAGVVRRQTDTIGYNVYRLKE